MNGRDMLRRHFVHRSKPPVEKELYASSNVLNVGRRHNGDTTGLQQHRNASQESCGAFKMLNHLYGGNQVVPLGERAIKMRVIEIQRYECRRDFEVILDIRRSDNEPRIL